MTEDEKKAVHLLANLMKKHGASLSPKVTEQHTSGYLHPHWEFPDEEELENMAEYSKKHSKLYFKSGECPRCGCPIYSRIRDPEKPPESSKTCICAPLLYPPPPKLDHHGLPEVGIRELRYPEPLDPTPTWVSTDTEGIK